MLKACQCAVVAAAIALVVGRNGRKRFKDSNSCFLKPIKFARI